MSRLLAIESSCDETSAAIMQDGKLLSHVISSQLEHKEYGGVIPELASRLHQQQIVRVVEEAISKAGMNAQDIDAIAFTRGPGLLGALLVGTSFAKGMALALGIPLVEVNHMQAHVLANFLSEQTPEFPFLCLTVSGGHTQLILVKDYLDMELLGETIDDAAGEAFDKAAKIMGLAYPGGPEIDRLAASGNPDAFQFPNPKVGRFEFSFSGLKTSLLYLLKDGIRQNPEFIEENLPDICGSYQAAIVDILLAKMKDAAIETGVRHLAIAGGVSANSELRRKFRIAGGVSANSELRRKFSDLGAAMQITAHIPPFEYCTDNAAMIAMAGFVKLKAGELTDLEVVPFTRGFQDRG